MEFPQGATQRLELAPGSTEVKFPYHSGGWARLTASVMTRGTSLVDDRATVHPIAGRVWAVLAVAGAALLGGILYSFLVIRRRA